MDSLQRDRRSRREGGVDRLKLKKNFKLVSIATYYTGATDEKATIYLFNHTALSYLELWQKKKRLKHTLELRVTRLVFEALNVA
jgi:hypothetical protein